jgi:FkbM family methyltransferase
MWVRLPDEVSISLRRFGYVEYELSAFLLNYLQVGQTFIDVGAHIGYFSRLAAHCVGPTGRVYSFEPTPSTFELLDKNLRPHANATPIQAAVWNSAGSLSLMDNGPGYSPYNSMFQSRLPESVRRRVDTSIHEVTAIALDNFVDQRGITPDVVKIDAESAEKNVLDGMTGLLRTARPLISLEVGDLGVPGVPLSADLIDLMLGHDYQVHQLSDGILRVHQPRDSYQYDNLVFVASEKGHLLRCLT